MPKSRFEVMADHFQRQLGSAGRHVRASTALVVAETVCHQHSYRLRKILEADATIAACWRYLGNGCNDARDELEQWARNYDKRENAVFKAGYAGAHLWMLSAVVDELLVGQERDGCFHAINCASKAYGLLVLFRHGLGARATFDISSDDHSELEFAGYEFAARVFTAARDTNPARLVRGFYQGPGLLLPAMKFLTNRDYFLERANTKVPKDEAGLSPDVTGEETSGREPVLGGQSPRRRRS